MSTNSTLRSINIQTCLSIINFIHLLLTLYTYDKIRSILICIDLNILLAFFVEIKLLVKYIRI